MARDLETTGEVTREIWEEAIQEPEIRDLEITVQVTKVEAIRG